MLTLAHERYTADALAVCRAHRGLPNGFLLFREVGAPLNRFKPSSKYFTDRYKAVLFCGSFIFFCRVCYVFVHVYLYMCLVATGWERADLLALACGV